MKAESRAKLRALWDLAWRGGIIALPFVLLAFCEVFVLPLNAFSFRLWEPLLVRRDPLGVMGGPFYRNQKLAMLEEGDLAHGSRLAVPKAVEWETDALGFRNARDLRLEDVELLMIGDSMIAGSSLTQSDRLSDVMTQRFRVPSYAYAPATYPSFFQDPRVAKLRPEVVLFEIIERSLPELAEGQKNSRRPASSPPAGIPEAAILGLTRLSNLKFPNYLQAEWQRIRLGRPPQGIVYEGSPMVFLQGEKAHRTYDAVMIERIVDRLVAYRGLAEARGMKFLFMPVPNKETLYFDLLPSKRPSRLIADVVMAATARGIDTLDAQAELERARREAPDRLLYHLDDTHWNGEAVRVLSEVLNARIETLRPTSAAR